MDAVLAAQTESFKENDGIRLLLKPGPVVIQDHKGAVHAVNGERPYGIGCKSLLGQALLSNQLGGELPEIRARNAAINHQGFPNTSGVDTIATPEVSYHIIIIKARMAVAPKFECVGESLFPLQEVLGFGGNDQVFRQTASVIGASGTGVIMSGMQVEKTEEISGHRQG